jgi:hypothetical protein
VAFFPTTSLAKGKQLDVSIMGAAAELEAEVINSDLTLHD